MNLVKTLSIPGACLVAALWLVGCGTGPSSSTSEEIAAPSEDKQDAKQVGQEPTGHQHEVLEPSPPEPTPPRPKPAAKPAAKPAEQPVQTPPPPSEPVWKEVQVTVGTLIAVQFDDPLSSAINKTGDVFHARVLDAVVVDGHEAIPAGSLVQGFVQEAKSAAHWDKGGLLVLRFDLVQLPSGEAVPLVASLTAEGQSAGAKKKAAIIGGSAAGGAILGKILGKNTKDAAVGAVVGGAIGTGVLAAQKGEEVEVPIAAPVFITVEQPLVVNIPA